MKNGYQATHPGRKPFALSPSTIRSKVANGSALLDGIDARSAPARRFKDLQQSMTSDLGGTPSGLQPWVASIEQALRGGGGFSAAFQYTSDTACNDQQRWSFPGPVIVVTSALSYSSAEFFAAGFQDHGGLILGIDETTGGGGAGVRLHDDLVGYFDGEPSPFVHLDRGGLSLAFRRSVRVGLGAGQEIEDAGVYRNRPYDMTRDDLLNGNRDLKREAARLLAQMT